MNGLPVGMFGRKGHLASQHRAPNHLCYVEMGAADFDIAIVGGGPAGATCLLALAGSGLRVLVVEKAVFPRPKACGDAVPGLALRVWEGLAPGLPARLAQLPSARSLADGYVCGPFGGRCRVQFVHPGLVVRRAELDAALLAYAQAQTPCTLATAALKSLEPLPDGFALHLADGRSFTTRRLAAADGATGPCRKLLTGLAWQAAEVSLAVRTYLPAGAGGAGADALALWFDKALLPGYLWAFPLADGTQNVGAGVLRLRPGQNLKQALAQWTARPADDERPQAEPDASAWLGQKLPLGLAGRSISGPGYCLLGDAGGLVAPATGDGIGQAALSGQLAAQALVASLRQRGLAETPQGLAQAYDAPLYRRLGPSFTAQRRMVALGRHAPWLLEGIIRLASRSEALRQRLASL